jgi:Flp pilus assembly CpaE family ATPase
MEGFGNHLEFAKYVASRLTTETFTLLDIGCSGGIANWHFLGDKLQAFGFAPNLEEIERLRGAERSINVSYWPIWRNTA